MKQKYFAVENSKDGQVGVIRIYGVIGDWWEGTTVNSFLRSFNDLESKFNTIHVHINSPGGNVHEGLAICNAIKTSAKDVHTFVDGIAFSMGAMIAISAKKGNVHMAKGSILMIHSVSTYIYGNADALRNEADVLDKYDETLGTFLTGRTGKTLEAVKSDYLNHEDHYFTAAEAKAEGLIDAIENHDIEEMPENVREMSAQAVSAWYAERMEEPTDNMISKVAARLQNMDSNKLNQENMFGNKFSKLAGLAKVAAGAITAEQMQEVNDQIAEAGVEGLTVVLDSELEAVTAQNETLSAEKTALEAEKASLTTAATTKDARITALEAEVAVLKGKPAGSPAAVVTDKVDNPEAGESGVVEDFTTDYDREAQKLFGK